MLSRRMLLIAAGGVVLPAPARAEAGPADLDGATRLIRDLADQAIAILRQPTNSLEQREKEFRRLLREGFALEFIGRFVLGRSWRTATLEQRTDYQVLFAEYLLKTYSRRLGGYAGETLVVSGARPAGQQDVLVQTRIQRAEGPPIVADWRVRKFEQGYLIIDVMVEGISMAVTQRAEFATVVQNNGMDGLLQALRARTQMFGVKPS